MKRTVPHIILTLFIALISISLNAQEEIEVYNAGMEYYSSGKFENAVEEWTKLVSNGYSSSTLFYNLGNAYFKSSNIPSAILYYEKASLLKPFDEDIRYNLEIARIYVVDKIDIIPELFFIRWFKMSSLFLSSNSWALLSAVTFILALLFFLIYLFGSRYLFKKISFIISVIMLVVSIISLSFSIENRVLTTGNSYAIVFSPSVTGKSSPDSGGSDLFIVHEGTKVKIEDEVGGWYEIRLPDGNIGWIESGEVRKI
ncbi:MAG TPA: SH3 domain-containing protein [Bacteroidales bacterium]|nr:SH3 domain-containing protein [Bacteroidales bacterium]